MAIVLATPGNTFPKFSDWPVLTLIGCCTVAVAVILALLTCAWAAAVARTVSARAASVSLEAVFIVIPLFIELWNWFASLGALPAAPLPCRNRGKGRAMSGQFLVMCQFL